MFIIKRKKDELLSSDYAKPTEICASLSNSVLSRVFFLPSFALVIFNISDTLGH